MVAIRHIQGGLSSIRGMHKTLIRKPCEYAAHSAFTPGAGEPVHLAAGQRASGPGKNLQYWAIQSWDGRSNWRANIHASGVTCNP